jgi:hypothetical protein
MCVSLEDSSAHWLSNSCWREKDKKRLTKKRWEANEEDDFEREE